MAGVLSNECEWSTDVSTTPTVPLLAGRQTVQLQLRRIWCAADVTQYASMWRSLRPRLAGVETP